MCCKWSCVTVVFLKVFYRTVRTLLVTALLEPLPKQDGCHPGFLSMLPELKQVTFGFVFASTWVLCSVHYAWLHHMPFSVPRSPRVHLSFRVSSCCFLCTFINVGSIRYLLPEEPGFFAAGDLLWMASLLLNQHRLCRKCGSTFFLGRRNLSSAF